MSAQTENSQLSETTSVPIHEAVSSTEQPSSSAGSGGTNIDGPLDPKKRIRARLSEASVGAWLQTVLNISVPLMIGVFTIVIMKNNQDMTRTNRQDDLEIARLQREADRSRSFEAGNETLFMNYLKTFADMYLAFRNVGQPPSIFVQSLTSSTLGALTLQKRRQILLFLYTGGYLYARIANSQNYLRYSVLDNIELNYDSFEDFRLAGARLINASFIGCALNFSYIGKLRMSGANFTKAKLNKVFFEEADLSYADFTETEMNNVVFKNVNLTGAVMSETLLSQALSLENSILPNGTLGEDKNFLSNGDGVEGLKHWSVNGSVQVRTDSSTNVTYFYGDNGALLTRRLNVTKYQSKGFSRVCCISLQYNNTITVSLSHNTSGFYISETTFALDNANGSQSNTPGFYSWTGCHEYDETRALFIDLKIAFTQSSNRSTPSVCRAVKAFLRFRDWTADFGWF